MKSISTAFLCDTQLVVNWLELLPSKIIGLLELVVVACGSDIKVVCDFHVAREVEYGHGDLSGADVCEMTEKGDDITEKALGKASALISRSVVVSSSFWHHWGFAFRRDSPKVPW